MVYNMFMRNIQFVNGYFYHIINRGVDKRRIFQDQRDYLRFYASLYFFNNPDFHFDGGIKVDPLLSNGTFPLLSNGLVSIASFCLMPNHFHMLLKQNSEAGISTFMHRVSSGYSKYFNRKYERKGNLFEGQFKAVLMKRDAQFEHLPRYVHLNVLDLTDLNWRDGKIEDWGRAEKFLEEYPWSSHNAYLGKPQQLPVVEKSIMGEIFDTPERYMKFLKEWSGRNI